jgi:hypothetical protein
MLPQPNFYKNAIKEMEKKEALYVGIGVIHKDRENRR